ncbi:hypothetical protein [Thomasclavelia ramosa]|uniref:hypothetical protein n=1 Tax=Thomasclavelia ramosa TaxID=1547 RepID=UPI0039841AD3
MGTRRNTLKQIEYYIGYSVSMAFHRNVAACLKVFCRHNSMSFNATKQQGGDKGVDFYIKDNDTYFAFSGSTNTSLDNTIKKIEHDLKRMTECVIDKGYYTGKISKFIFIYNTFGDEKANDPESRIDNLFGKYFDKYYKFDFAIWNVEDLRVELDNCCSDELLIAIMEEIDLISSNNSPFIMDEIRDVLNKIEDTEKSEQDFVRKSTSKKIEDNNLTVIKMDIEDFLTDEWYSRFETVISEPDYNEKFMLFKNAIVNIYNSNKKNFSGLELFDAIIDTVKERYSCSKKASKYLVVYIFDKCDIF